MSKKPWEGRFRKPTDPMMVAFTESLSFDRALAFVDIEGSLAHAEMLASVGILSARDLAAIRKGMKEILRELRENRFVFDPADEDVHMSIEKALTAKVGDPARRLHTARSRNDQVATDLRLWTRQGIDALGTLLREVQRSLVAVADREREIVIPGYTHLQRAQPVMLAQHLLAYAEMFERDRERLADARKRINRCPLGACALAGTTLPIDRARVAKQLGFDGLCENSMDAVSDRDFVVETLSALAITAMHMSRLAEDVILWTSSEWSLAVLDDAWSTGSSIMPQKRNPDLMELTRGKTGRVYGALTCILTVLKGLPMTYNRDLQEDKEPLFDAMRTVRATAECLARFLPTLTFRRERATEMLRDGFLDATVMAEYLVEKGLPFRMAHEASGKMVALAESRGVTLADLTLKDLKEASDRFGPDVFKRLNPAKAPQAYRSAGAAGPKEAAKAIQQWRKRFAKSQKA